jgi:plastocyanin
MKKKKHYPASNYFFIISIFVVILSTSICHAVNHIIEFGGQLGLIYSPSELTVEVGDSVTWEGDFSVHPLSSTSVPAGAATFNNSTGTSFSYLVQVQGTYNYQCDAHYQLGMVGSFSAIVSSVQENAATIQPVSFGLEQNYPNPFNPITTIKYQLAVAGNVELSIYNLSGQKIETLVSTWQPAGQHQVQWNAGEKASGVYYYILHAGDSQVVKSMVLMK